jgi:polar amino acid transport system substrate-binding protein
MIRFVLLAALACAAFPVTAAELSPTGVLRATYNSLNAREARFDRKTQTVVGPTAELTKELARKLNVPFEMLGVEGAPAVIDRVKTRHADVGFVPCDATMAKEVDFSQAYMEVRGVAQCIIVARGGHMKLDIINGFINDVRASGKLREIVMR